MATITNLGLFPITLEIRKNVYQDLAPAASITVSDEYLPCATIQKGISQGWIKITSNVSTVKASYDAKGVFSGLTNSSGIKQLPLKYNQLVGAIRGAGSGLPTAPNSVITGSTIKSFAGAISAWGPFNAVQLIYSNHTNAPALVDNSCVATSNTAYPGGVFNIAAPTSTWSACGPVTVPASAGADTPTRNKRPGMILSPKMPARSVPRLAGDKDGGKYELLFWRNVRLGANANFVYGDLGTGFNALWDPVNEGFSVLIADPTYGTDTVANTSSVTTSTRETPVPGVSISGVLFHYDQKMTTIGGVGDSVYVGMTPTGPCIAPYLFKSTARIRASGKMVSYYNAAVSGSSMQIINNHGKDVVDLNMIDIMVLASHTINGAIAGQALGNALDWDNQWFYLMDLAQYHLDKKAGNQVLLLTPLPNSSFTAGQNALRLIQRDRVMKSGFPYVDMESLADSGGRWADPSIGGDGTHPNQAGHEAISNLLQPVLADMVP